MNLFLLAVIENIPEFSCTAFSNLIISHIKIQRMQEAISKG